MSVISKIVIHCSDTPNGRDIGVKEITKWHVEERGWTTIGYHYVIRIDGTVEVGRYHNGDSVLEGKEIGSHAKGHNSDSLSICLVGRDNFTYEQYHNLCLLLEELLDRYSLSADDIFGHRELDSGKECPGNLDLDKLRKDVA